MNPFFPEIHTRFGFGCMRFPTLENGEVDQEATKEMVDTFLAKGFNYFDTAHGYLSEKSETTLRSCLTSRYPRDRYILTNKLSNNYFKSEAEILPLFEKQLEACGVDYFDFYLMHAQNDEIFRKYKACRAYETAFHLKELGKVRHVGLSFHDKAEVLDQILTEHPQVEVVQLQFNYADYDDPAVQSRLCYEVCQKHGKPVFVMEPVKGGKLVNLPAEAAKVLDDLHGGSYASYALRFAAHFPGVAVVLSGMGSMEMVRDNMNTMADPKPLSEAEMEAIAKVTELFHAQRLIPCTACRYCVDGCPKHILIPDLFACMNAKRQHKDWNSDYYYEDVYTVHNGKAGDCIHCGKCEQICPQHLKIRDLLETVSATFDKSAD